MAGHKSALAFGLMGEGVGVPVVAMLGRVRITFLPIELRLLNCALKFHFYEGHDFHAIMYPIRVMARLGVKSIISECNHMDN